MKDTLIIGTAGLAGAVFTGALTAYLIGSAYTRFLAPELYPLTMKSFGYGMTSKGDYERKAALAKKRAKA